LNKKAIFITLNQNIVMAAAIKKALSNKKTWQEKLKTGKKAEVKKNDFRFADIPAGSSLLIVTPEITDKYIRQIPKGHFTDIKQIRKDLAADHKAQYSCPVTTGISIRIVAEAAYEQLEKGTPLTKITPFWRALSAQSPSAKKLSFGIDFLLAQQRKEGII
jgi:hypothetical protein